LSKLPSEEKIEFIRPKGPIYTKEFYEKSVQEIIEDPDYQPLIKHILPIDDHIINEGRYLVVYPISEEDMEKNREKKIHAIFSHFKSCVEYKLGYQINNGDVMKNASKIREQLRNYQQ
jgi:hypothetical protein